MPDYVGNSRAIGAGQAHSSFDAILKQMNACGPAMWLDALRCTTKWAQVTDSKLANQLIGCNTVVHLNTMSDPQWFCGYQYNQRLQTSTMSVCSKELRTRHMCYSNQEVDRHELKDLCNDPGLMVKRNELSAKVFDEMIEGKFLSFLDSNVPLCNTGDFVAPGVRLGSQTAPFELNLQNARAYRSMWDMAFKRRNANQGRRVIWADTMLQQFFMFGFDRARDADRMGEGLCNVPDNLGCNQFVFTNCGTQLRPVVDAAGNFTLPVIGYDIDALSVAAGVGERRTVEGVENEKMYFREFAFYGMVVKRPELLFKGYVKIAADWYNQSAYCCPTP